MTDDTLEGYQRAHDRAPAFGGSDGCSYSVATYVDDAPDADGRYGGALLFVRWSPAGDRPLGHLETEYLAFGGTPGAALEPILRLPLRDVKAHLDRCIADAAREGGA